LEVLEIAYPTLHQIQTLHKTRITDLIIFGLKYGGTKQNRLYKVAEAFFGDERFPPILSQKDRFTSLKNIHLIRVIKNVNDQNLCLLLMAYFFPVLTSARSNYKPITINMNFLKMTKIYKVYKNFKLDAIELTTRTAQHFHSGLNQFPCKLGLFFDEKLFDPFDEAVHIGRTLESTSITSLMIECKVFSLGLHNDWVKEFIFKTIIEKIADLTSLTVIITRGVNLHNLQQFLGSCPNIEDLAVNVSHDCFEHIPSNG